MNLRTRSYKKELLDEEDIPFEALKRNMQELNIVNTWLGGHSISIAGLRKVIGKRNKLVVCEIGCGGGDNLIALKNWCDKNNIPANFIGVDIKPECIEIAKKQTGNNFYTWIVSDYRLVQFQHLPDVIFSSLFCHHFTTEELVEQLRWMRSNSIAGFFINDLHRHPFAYWSIKIITRLFSRSYLVKNDAPLSVARGFTRPEWKAIAKGAAMSINIQWKWAFRYLITFRHG